MPYNKIFLATDYTNASQSEVHKFISVNPCNQWQINNSNSF